MTLEELRAQFNGTFDELMEFTRKVRRLAELDDEYEPETVTFLFIIGAMQSQPAHCLPMWHARREDLARELAHVITSVG